MYYISKEGGELVLTNKVALLTGANGGIGSAVCEQYLACGAKCWAVDLSKSPSSQLQKMQDKYSDNFHYEYCDLRNLESINQIISKCIKSWGKIDILFNNAAIFDMGLFLETDEKQYDQLFEVNVKGMYFMLQSVAKVMALNKQGKIINMASQAGRRGEALVAHYCATKAAVISYTQSAALALADYGIQVNAISPGVVDTPMWNQVDALFAKYENLSIGEKKRLVAKEIPLGRIGTPSDIAYMALFLASGLSDYITGQTYNVDGGSVLN